MTKFHAARPLGMACCLLAAGLVLGATAPVEQVGVSSGTISLRNANHTLRFDPKTGRLLSFRSALASAQEFLESADDDPVFVLQYLDGHGRFRQIASTQARKIEAQLRGAHELALTFGDLAGLDLQVTVTVRTSPDINDSFWSLSLRNHAGLFITDVQFPFVVVAYHLGGNPGT